jgi:hypothetical protein
VSCCFEAKRPPAIKADGQWKSVTAVLLCLWKSGDSLPAVWDKREHLFTVESQNLLALVLQRALYELWKLLSQF